MVCFALEFDSSVVDMFNLNSSVKDFISGVDKPSSFLKTNHRSARFDMAAKCIVTH